jgi:hypothetical protein
MINKNDRFRHLKTGNIYIIVTKTKIKVDTWKDGVIYTREDIEYGDFYTRELSDFEIKFEKIYFDSKK